jgi:hypothetical protein
MIAGHHLVFAVGQVFLRQFLREQRGLGGSRIVNNKHGSAYQQVTNDGIGAAGHDCTLQSSGD